MSNVWAPKAEQGEQGIEFCQIILTGLSDRAVELRHLWWLRAARVTSTIIMVAVSNDEHL